MSIIDIIMSSSLQIFFVIWSFYSISLSIDSFDIGGSSINSRRYPTSSISKLHLSIATIFSLQPTSNNNTNNNKNDGNKLNLLNLLSQVPSNQSTPKQLTTEILQTTSILEKQCPTIDENVLERLVGNWELIWTAQDVSSLDNDEDNDRLRRLNPFATFINPCEYSYLLIVVKYWLTCISNICKLIDHISLVATTYTPHIYTVENQSYSNNPINNNKFGRSNPIMPQSIQDTMEDIGILSTPNSSNKDNTIKSTQSINLKKNCIRNVVAFELNNPLPTSKNGSTIKGLITVDVKGYPNRSDKRRIDVKFDSCRVSFLNSPIDITFPLGIIGPTGWLRTSYVDDDIRITRGHKGSVFILSRTSSNSK